jgi:hypothetical protein
MAGQTRTWTSLPTRFTGIRWTRHFQSPVLCIGLQYILSHSGILLLITNYWLAYVAVLFWCIGCLDVQSKQRHKPYLILKMSITKVLNIVRHLSWVIWAVMDCIQSSMRDCLPLYEKVSAERSLSHCENQHQQSINNCWSCITSNHSLIWPLMFIYIVLTGGVC